MFSRVSAHPTRALAIRDMTRISATDDPASPHAPVIPIGVEGLASPTEALEVLSSRKGHVLYGFAMLKPDFFPGLARASAMFKVSIEGAPNFRQIPDRPVCGVSIPTAQGLKNVLKFIRSHDSMKEYKRVVWFNLREYVRPVCWLCVRLCPRLDWVFVSMCATRSAESRASI